MEKLGVVRIAGRFQGPTGQGQGGWTASRLAAFADGPVTVRLAAPTPLDVDLDVVREGDALELIDPRGRTPRTIMQAELWTPDVPETAPVSVDAARAARLAFRFDESKHPAPNCFSCGVSHESMQVKAGLLGDGRVATDWRPPAWATRDDGAVDLGVVWAAMDCAAGWFVGADGGGGSLIFTAQYAVEVRRPLVAEAEYAVVAWSGDGAGGWEGRKRTAASMTFDAAGEVVAAARSLWIAARPQ